MKIIFCFIAIIAMGLSSCKNSDIPTSAQQRWELYKKNYILTREKIDQYNQNKSFKNLIPQAKYEVKIVPFIYETTVFDKDKAVVSGTLFLPIERDRPSEIKKPLYVYTKGTDLYKYSMVAFNHKYKFETQLMIGLYAAQGYPLVIFDMLGYGISDFPYHPYLHKNSESQTVADGINAAFAKLEEIHYPIDKKIFLFGHSQGGHTVAATLELLNRQKNNDFSVNGAAYLSPPLNLKKMILDDEAMLGFEIFGSMLIISYNKIYKNSIYKHVEEVFKQPYAATIESSFPSAAKIFNYITPKDPTIVMFEQLSGKIPFTFDGNAAKKKLITENFKAKIKNNSSALIKHAEQNNMIDFVPTKPLLICYGKKDLIVPPHLNALKYQKSLKKDEHSNITFKDVDPLIVQYYGNVPRNNLSRKIFLLDYHARMALLLCSLESKRFFDEINNNH